MHYKEDSRIKGVILNRLSPMMYGRMKEMIEVQTGIKVYGYVPVMKDCALESRYLGLKLPKERKDTEDKLTRLGGKENARIYIRNGRKFGRKCTV